MVYGLHTHTFIHLLASEYTQPSFRSSTDLENVYSKDRTFPSFASISKVQRAKKKKLKVK